MEKCVLAANIFVLDGDEAYAGTSGSDWKAIVEVLEFLKPADLDDIKPENQECDICRESFGHSGDRSRPEEPVSLPCGHVFGRDCIENWISVGRGPVSREPDTFDDSFDEILPPEDGETELYDLVTDSDRPLLTRTETFTCPKCRADFTIAMSAAQAPAIAARLRFWDHAYEKLGIVRSAREEASRQDLWQFVLKTKADRIVDDSSNLARSLERRAQVSAMRFVLRRSTWNLGPAQRIFLDAFFHLGCFGAHDAPFHYHPAAYENRRIPLWCWQFDRMERGLNPSYAWSRGADVRDRFVTEWQEQRMGPWSRALFEGLGMDRSVWRSLEWWEKIVV